MLSIKHTWIVLFGLLIFWKCEKPLTAEIILNRSIKAHRYDPPIDSLTYIKTSQLFFPDGTLEKESIEKHHLRWRPFVHHIYSNNQHLSWRSDSIYNHIDATVLKEGKEYIAAKNKFNAAYFVFWQPAKLVDKKAVLVYKGQEMLPNQQPVHAIEVSYTQHNSTDQWVFYFDTKNYLNRGYSVQHNGRWSLILNDEFHLKHHPILVKKRRSFMVDSLTNRRVLRAAYTYEISSLK